MPQSPTGWLAFFKPYRVEPVVGWDENGVALVVDTTTGRRATIHDLDGHDFEALDTVDDPIVAALPAAGWTLAWSDGTTEPVVGFAVQNDGYALPLVTNAGGYALPYTACEGEPIPKLVPPEAA
jgi:hypothetical protein